jgi:hypothetical protein
MEHLQPHHPFRNGIKNVVMPLPPVKRGSGAPHARSNACGWACSALSPEGSTRIKPYPAALSTPRSFSW